MVRGEDMVVNRVKGSEGSHGGSHGSQTPPTPPPDEVTVTSPMEPLAPARRASMPMVAADSSSTCCGCFGGFISREPFFATRPKMKLGSLRCRDGTAPTRMLLEYVGAYWEELRYPAPDDWFLHEHDVSRWLQSCPGQSCPRPSIDECLIPEELRLPGVEHEKVRRLVNLPYVVDMGKDRVHHRADSIFEYLMECYHLHGDQHGRQMLEEAYKVQRMVIDLAYPQRQVCATYEEFRKAMANHLAVTIRDSYKFIEELLQKSKGPYCCGRGVRGVDFQVWEMLDQTEAFCRAYAPDQPSPLVDFPRLGLLYAAFRLIPRLQRYFRDDEFYRLPFHAEGSHSHEATLPATSELASG